MNHERRADVLIVGGGPAGSTAAFRLARQGYDVLLIDKAHHPRETVGESVLPSAWKYFDLLGVSQAIERDGYVKKAGGVVVWGDDITLLLLDNARRAGVRVCEGMRAESFRQNGSGRTEVVIAEEAGTRSDIS